MTLTEKKIDLLSQDLDEVKAGRALFELVAACRKSGLDPEASLRSFASKQMKEVEKALA